MKDFCHVYNCQNIIKDKTCFKNPQKPSCIDLVITDRQKSFQNSMVIETGLSDFHKMSLTVMKVFYKKQGPNIIRYRSYRNFNNELFINEVENNVSENYSQECNLEFEIFKDKVGYILEKHAPIKKRYIRANQAPFIDKTISKHIMKRSRLRNKFLNTKSDIDRKAYNVQRNLCVTLIRQAKKRFFNNLDTGDITDNKTFWKTVKPFLTDKVKIKSKITLLEKKQKENQAETFEEIISDDKEIAETFNEFFINIVPNLKISTDHFQNSDFQVTENPVLNAINKYKYHPSVIKIKEKIDKQLKFSFTAVQYEDILKKIKSLKVSKASQESDIPTKVLLENSEFFASFFHENLNHCL